jgi:hypothetical protein
MSDLEKTAVPDKPRSVDEKKTFRNDTDSVIDSTEVDSGQVQPIADDPRAESLANTWTSILDMFP